MLLNNNKKIVVKRLNSLFLKHSLIKNFKSTNQFKLNSKVVQDLSNLEVATIQILHFWAYKSQHKLL